MELKEIEETVKNSGIELKVENLNELTTFVYTNFKDEMKEENKKKDLQDIAKIIVYILNK